jgi:hypothetical protein
MSAANSAIVRQKYRSLARLVKLLPESQASQSWEELRVTFRKPLGIDETVDYRIAKADERLSFLRMITPKAARLLSSSIDEEMSGGRWVYKDGKRLEYGASATRRDQNGRVVSNWDGKNLDPDSVKRHNHHLKRLGFRNNAHAKGIF